MKTETIEEMIDRYEAVIAARLSKKTNEDYKTYRSRVTLGKQVEYLRKVKKDCDELTELNPACGKRYKSQLHEIMDRVEEESRK